MSDNRKPISPTSRDFNNYQAFRPADYSNDQTYCFHCREQFASFTELQYHGCLFFHDVQTECPHAKRGGECIGGCYICLWHHHPIENCPRECWPRNPPSYPVDLSAPQPLHVPVNLNPRNIQGIRFASAVYGHNADMAAAAIAAAAKANAASDARPLFTPPQPTPPKKQLTNIAVAAAAAAAAATAQSQAAFAANQSQQLHEQLSYTDADYDEDDTPPTSPVAPSAAQ